MRATAREAHENRLLPLPSRVSFARPVLSGAHYFQAPATQAARETREESASACPRVPWKSFTPSPLACLSRAPRSFLCPLLPSACYAGCLGLCLRSLMIMLMLMLVLGPLVRTGLNKTELEINFSLSYRC